jgi:hypothetical protein
MDASSTSKGNSNSIQRVRDPSGILLTVIGTILILLIAFFVNSFLFFDFSFSQVIYALVFNSLLLIIIFRLKTIWNGIELDIENRRMSFQGGGIAANDFSDYFKPDFLLQYFKRFDISIDEISQIQANDTTREFYNKSIKQWQTSTTYQINFVGSFGSASVNFSYGGKRDQIYNAIRQLNNMGTPIVKAN